MSAVRHGILTASHCKSEYICDSRLGRLVIALGFGGLGLRGLVWAPAPSRIRLMKGISDQSSVAKSTVLNSNAQWWWPAILSEMLR
jgi:hypothetical protein